MKLTSFDDLINMIKNEAPKKIAIAAAEDEEVLAAIRQAQDKGIANGILVGHEKSILQVCKDHKIDTDGFEIINEPDPYKATRKCCALVRSGKASVVMKGLIDTSLFMRAVLNKETGLNGGNLISHVAVYELEHYHKLLMITDAAINVAPDIYKKVKIIDNTVHFAHSLGIETPLIACCAAIEKINSTQMPATVDAALLAKMSDRGQIKGAIVDGPFGLDNAISAESARIKGLTGPVAGNADIILCNDIESANYLYKALTFLTNSKAGAIVLGATAPIVLTSRADSHDVKYLSILLSVVN